jgi:hypothetical protein
MGEKHDGEGHVSAEDSSAARPSGAEVWLETRMQEMGLELQAAADAGDYAEVDNLARKLDSFELVLWDLQKRRLGQKRQPTDREKELAVALRALFATGGSPEDALPMLKDLQAVWTAEDDQELAESEQESEWRRTLSALSPSVRADLETARKIRHLREQIEDARDKLKATEDREQQAVFDARIRSLSIEVKALREAARRR